jgi:hypothetical protein
VEKAEGWLGGVAGYFTHTVVRSREWIGESRYWSRKPVANIGPCRGGEFGISRNVEVFESDSAGQTVNLPVNFTGNGWRLPGRRKRKRQFSTV